MPLNMEKLHGKGIRSIGIEISFTDVRSDVTQTLKRNGIGTDDAQVFSIKTVGDNGQSEKPTVLGRLDAVLHKNTRGLNLRGNLIGCKCVVFIYTLYTEPEHTGCGIASNMLAQLPIWVKKEFGFAVDAELLAPAPQWKDDKGEIVQIPFGIAFLVQQTRLISFYSERGFNFNDDFLTMYKRLGVADEYIGKAEGG